MSASLTLSGEVADPLLPTSCHNSGCREALQKCKLEIAGLYREAADSRTIKAEQANQEAAELGKDGTIDQLLKELQDERNARKHVERQMDDASERERVLHADLVAANKTTTDLKDHIANHDTINTGTLKLIHRDVDDHHMNTSSDTETLEDQNHRHHRVGSTQDKDVPRGRGRRKSGSTLCKCYFAEEEGDWNISKECTIESFSSWDRSQTPRRCMQCTDGRHDW